MRASALRHPRTLTAVQRPGSGRRVWHWARVLGSGEHAPREPAKTALCGSGPEGEGGSWIEDASKTATCTRCIERLAPEERKVLLPEERGREHAQARP